MDIINKLFIQRFFNLRIFNIIVIICSSVLLTTCMYSDGTFWFERSNWGRTFNHFYKIDRMETLNHFTPDSIDFVIVGLGYPTDSLYLTDYRKCVRHFKNNGYEMEDWDFPVGYETSKEIKFNRDDIINLSASIITLKNELLVLLKKENDLGGDLYGDARINNYVDTNLLYINKSEFYHSNSLRMYQSNNGILESLSLKSYFGTTLLNIGNSKHDYNDPRNLTLKRVLANKIINKFINSVIDYKNNQLGLQNDSLRILNKPHLEKYTWLKHE